MGVEEKLEERDLKREEVEATLHGQIKEMEREGTDAEAIKDQTPRGSSKKETPPVNKWKLRFMACLTN